MSAVIFYFSQETDIKMILLVFYFQTKSKLEETGCMRLSLVDVPPLDALR